MGRDMSETRHQGVGEVTGRQMAAFAAWLGGRRLASSSQIPFFLRWVDRFLRMSGRRPAEAWRDTLRVFLEDLAEGQTPDWQIRQAADAVTLYCSQFREQ